MRSVKARDAPSEKASQSERSRRGKDPRGRLGASCRSAPSQSERQSGAQASDTGGGRLALRDSPADPGAHADRHCRRGRDRTVRRGPCGQGRRADGSAAACLAPLQPISRALPSATISTLSGERAHHRGRRLRRARAVGKGGQSIFARSPGLRPVRARLIRLALGGRCRGAAPSISRFAVAVRLIEKRPFALWKNGNGGLTIIERSGAL